MMRYGKALRLLLMSLFAALVLNPAVATIATAGFSMSAANRLIRSRRIVLP